MTFMSRRFFDFVVNLFGRDIQHGTVSFDGGEHHCRIPTDWMPGRIWLSVVPKDHYGCDPVGVVWVSAATKFMDAFSFTVKSDRGCVVQYIAREDR